jgi:hypothetical protein
MSECELQNLANELYKLVKNSFSPEDAVDLIVLRLKKVEELKDQNDM